MTITTEIYAFLLAPACLHAVALGVLQAYPSGPPARMARVACRVIGTVAILGTLSAFRAALGLGSRSIGRTAGAMWFLLAAAVGAALVVSAFRARPGGVTTGRILRWVLAVPAVLFFVVNGTMEVRSITRRVSSSMARSHLERMLEAEREYAKDNAGFFDKLSCLTGDARCRPGGAFGSYISTDDLAPSGDGYQRAFHPGPAVPRAEIDRAHASPTSLRSFAFVMEPLSADTGVQAYCGQSDGLICSRWTEKMPKPVNGRCVREEADSCSCPKGDPSPDGTCDR
jgi:hypothetical protein